MEDLIHSLVIVEEYSVSDTNRCIRSKPTLKYLLNFSATQNKIHRQVLLQQLSKVIPSSGSTSCEFRETLTKTHPKDKRRSFYLYLIKVKFYCNSLKLCNHCKKGIRAGLDSVWKKNVRKLTINVGARNTCECTRNNCNICTRRILLISGDQGRVIVTDSNFNHACSGLFNRANWLKYVRAACSQSVCM